MKPILEYIISKNSKIIQMIHTTNDTIHQIVKDEIDRLGHDANLNHIDVSEVTNMNNLFSCDSESLGSEYTDLNPDISKWNISNVTNMYYMFWGCKNFNQDISKWDVSKVEDMGFMFYNCENFNQDISRWDVSKVENMMCMFKWCENFNQDLSQWDVSNVKNSYWVFKNCPIREEYKPHFARG